MCHAVVIGGLLNGWATWRIWLARTHTNEYNRLIFGTSVDKRLALAADGSHRVQFNSHIFDVGDLESRWMKAVCKKKEFDIHVLERHGNERH